MIMITRTIQYHIMINDGSRSPPGVLVLGRKNRLNSGQPCERREDERSEIFEGVFLLYRLCMVYQLNRRHRTGGQSENLVSSQLVYLPRPDGQKIGILSSPPYL